MKILEYFKSHKEEINNFNLLPDGIFTLEQDGKIVDINEKILKIFNTTKFNVIGKYFSDFIENGTKTLNKIVSDGSSIVVRSNTTNDEEIPRMYFEITASRAKETDKIYVILRNVTSQKRTQANASEKYEAAQKIIDEKNDFLLNASGAILSNIISINGFSRALLDGIGGALSEKQQKYLNIINANSRDLNYDLEKLFALFKLESGKIEYQYRVFDILGMIKSIERVYKKDIENRQIAFSLDYSTLLQRDCYLDGEIVEYILRCIMDIFVRFTTIGKCQLTIGHPPIEFLKTREFSANDSLDCQKYILFEAKISDLTFTQEELDNIFDAYYKGTTKRPIGLKATLNMLKIYINAFGGEIWVYSKQNFGTMFTFVLPLR